MVLLLFFFQAEDGIRDLVRSRGLGDVYKRQEQRREQIDPARAGRLHILEVQRLIRTMPKVVVALSLIHI